MALRITHELQSAIEEEGRGSYPFECCGFLVGRMNADDKEVREIWTVRNEKAQEESRRRYWISPEVYFENDKRARKEGMDILGIYHSHPDHPGEPSEFDREHALPGWSYVVFAVAKGSPGPLGSWLLAEDRSAFHPEDLRVERTA